MNEVMILAATCKCITQKLNYFRNRLLLLIKLLSLLLLITRLHYGILQHQ